MATDARRLPFALDPLIAEAKRRTRKRRLLVACVAIAIGTSAASLNLDQRSPSTTAINAAGLRALVGTWSHHGGTLVISTTGRGLAKIFLYGPPGYEIVRFRVTSVRGTGRSEIARIRVTHDSTDPRKAGTPGTVRLSRGVIYWSAAGFGGTTFCSVKPGARWICGL